MENKNLQFIDFTVEELIYLSSFYKTTKYFDLATYMFHYGAYSEESICINKNNSNEWEIYIVERGKIHSKVTFTSYFDVCLELLKYCSDTNEEYKEFMSYFINEELKMKNSLNQIETNEIIPEVNNVLLQLIKIKK